ncbi:MAG: HEAT repeat domain-containing protein [Bacteroidales bacterium]|nr:HEAT repeat domain-containing protein [Bacteroidales bacterium]
MKNSLRLLFTALLTLCAVELSAAEKGFAIVIDPISYKETKTEVDAYAQSIEKQGLKTYIIEDVWYNPDSIKTKIIELATQKKAPIEGVVFIGDIPVPMIRDAQHFTSAFKAKQDPKKMEFSSVPSDRFYDDFDLQFSFIEQSKEKSNQFYYSLTAQSTQVCQPDIYSARMKTCDKEGKSKYDRLKAYLKKVVAQKETAEKLSQVFYFAGQGYNSDCGLARVDEKSSYYEMFPNLLGQPWSLTYQNHADYEFSKYPLMSQMQRKDLSLAVLHHHGYPDTEYLDDNPIPQNAEQNLDAVKSFFRAKINTAILRGKDTTETINYYKEGYDVPEHWFTYDALFGDDIKKKDSIYAEQMDLHLTDLGKYKPNARVVILDACYNGAFCHDEYIAEEYIFEEGDCVVTIANSVNSLQDKWCDRNIGMFGLGLRVGNFIKYNPYFESHIFGDPTYTFTPFTKLGFNVNEALYKSNRFWKKQLKSEYAALQAFAINELAQRKAISSAEILDIFKRSPYQTVRFMALNTLATYKDDNYIECLSLGLNDNYELIRRFASIQAGKCGDLRLIPALVSLLSKPSIGKRVDFQLKMALALFPYNELVAEFKKQNPCKDYYNAEEETEKILKSFDNYSDKTFDGDVEQISNPEVSAKNKLKVIRSFRNRPLHPAVKEIIAAFKTIAEPDLQTALIETMGWFNMSYKRAEIADYFKTVSENEKYDKSVRNEALKTYKRLMGI